MTLSLPLLTQVYIVNGMIRVPFMRAFQPEAYLPGKTGEDNAWLQEKNHGCLCPWGNGCTEVIYLSRLFVPCPLLGT